MKKRIFWSICITALASVLLVSACVLALLYNKIDTDTWNSLETQIVYVAEGYGAGGEGYLATVAKTTDRITLVAPDGTVLYDDVENTAAMENHATRPEIADALANGSGRATRQSETLGKRTFNVALLLAGGNVLRVSTTVDTLLHETLRFIPWLLALCVLVTLLAMAVARRLSAYILNPLDKVNLANPLESEAYGELSPLLRRIAKQNDQIDEQIRKLRERQQEFDTITANMDEGLVVLGTDSTVLSMNASARHILAPGSEDSYHGRHILEVNRDLVLDKAVKQSLAGNKEEYVLELAGRKYRLLASPASGDGAVRGAVLLLVDETEKLEAENLRREFSANVSHELKTPLTSISGYAEILQKGLVKPEDITDFAGRIRDEAIRLIDLVGDIIKLSKLDEKDTAAVPEGVNLLALSNDAVQALKAPAAEKSITVSVKGSSVEVNGIRSILSEVVYNLLDNAIKYNRDNGEVLITVWQEENTAYLKMSDTGAGIPPDQQTRVFERFFRGDTSHFKGDISGTGLGLSIVKRGVLFHGGEVSLESMPGRGSSFLVSLPIQGN